MSWSGLFFKKQGYLLYSKYRRWLDDRPAETHPPPPLAADIPLPHYSLNRYWNFTKIARFSRRKAGDIHGRSRMPSAFRSRSIWFARR